MLAQCQVRVLVASCDLYIDLPQVILSCDPYSLTLDIPELCALTAMWNHGLLKVAWSDDVKIFQDKSHYVDLILHWISVDTLIH